MHLNILFTDRFDYRPYVCYWCPGLRTLDGFPVTDNERYTGTLVHQLCSQASIIIMDLHYYILYPVTIPVVKVTSV